MLDWNDLQYFLVVAREGSTTSAAKALGVSQSTVQRRLAEFEKRIGRALVVRQTSGYELTPLARELVPLAEGVAGAVDAFEKKIQETSRDGKHLIRLTCPEPVVGRLRPLIERFHERYPAFQVEFVTSDRYLDLLKGEADVAFRSGDTDDALIGHAVADSVWGVFASASYLEMHGRPKDLADLDRHRLLSLDESMTKHRIVQWLESVAPHAEIVGRSQGILGLVESARAGLGIAPLPVGVAEGAGLVKLFAPVRELGRTWRLLTHPQLRDSPHIAAFFDFVAAERGDFRSVFG